MDKYKITLLNKELYREVELPGNVSSFKIGTTIDCDYRIYKDMFFEEIKLEFIKNSNNQWSMICSDNLFITNGESKRFLNVNLLHGSTFAIKYQESNNEVLSVTFSIDFDEKKVDYNREIATKDKPYVIIGSTSDCNILLSSPYIPNDKIVLSKNNGCYVLNIVAASYDVKHNGNTASQGEIISYGDFISLADFSFYVTENSIWMEKSDRCRIAGLSFNDYAARNNYPKFIRNTRVKHVLDEEEIEILDPPAKPQKPKTNLLMSLLPAISMLVASGVMAYMGGVTMLIFSGVSAGMAILTSIIGITQGKKDYKKEVLNRTTEYTRYISEKTTAINSFREEEADELENIYINKERINRNFDAFSPDLFDREKTDSDFLHVCLGRGDVEATKKIQFKKQEKLEIEDELQVLPERLYNEYKVIHGAPIICDYHNSNAIGVIGNNMFKYDVLKSNVFDICARQFYTDVKLFFIMEEGNKALAHNFRLLPYVNNTIPNGRNIVCDEESKNVVFEYIYNELSRRETVEKADYPHFVIFFYDMCGFASHPISRFVKDAASLGVTFVFFGNDSSEIPQGCDYLVKQKVDDIAELVDSKNVSLSKEFIYFKVSDAEIARMNMMLAPVVAEEISLEGSLTKSIDLFKMLNILGVEDLDLKSRWAGSQVFKSMAVPLGVSKTGVVYLDLHDKAHGPHGLVAGTTGSGKSEILQSYILSVATYFHPYEIGFVIIDFKGGGMVNQFRDLPHLLGAITNIDGKEIDRSLKSIKAELQKRQRLFAEAEVNHIDKYIQKFKKNEVKEPLPHLIIIVDEFAELKAEQPEFMKELISAARIGRSLGVHLILATQKPAGQVDDQIWSNSKFKLCLKVQDQQDSNEVLKSPLAAEIKEPGRAYLQVGNNEIFELFQSAYSGAGEKAEDDSSREYRLCELNLSGKRKLVFEQKKQKQGDQGRTQLEAIVDYVNRYCENQGIKHLPSICLESLAKVLDYTEKKESFEGLFDIGMYDDPDNQYQGSTLVDINSKNTLIIGSSQYGKTNLLQLLIREIATVYTPKEANIYILDFGSMVLKNFESLNHVGGVVTSSDDEKLKNLFKLLMEEIAQRKEKLVSVGVSSFAAYLEAGQKDLPRIYLMVDNMTALMELYLQNDDTLLTIVREGLAVGISIIMANAQTSGIGFKYLSNFANKICLYCNDSAEYGNVFDHVTLRPEDLPGRCVYEVEKRMLECQTYLAFQGEKEFERVEDIRAFIAAKNEEFEGQYARAIPYIPTLLVPEVLEKDFGAEDQEYKLAVGLTYTDVLPFYLDFAKLGAMGLCGKEKKGHKNFISGLLNKLNANAVQNPVQVTIIDDVSRKYKEFSDLPIVSDYTLDATTVVEKLSAWHAILEERYMAMLEEREPRNNDMLVLIVQNNEVAKRIYEDMDAMNQYNDIVGRFKAFNVCIIYANFDNAAVSYDAPEPFRMLKMEQHILLFDDLDTLKVFDVPYEELRANKKKLQMGDAYYIKDNAVTKLKLLKHS